MKPKLEKQKGWTEVIIDDDCEFNKFYKAAEVLQTNFNLTFTKKLDDFDSLYWDFNYKQDQLVLFYNIYEGTTIFPKGFKASTQSENESAVEIGTLLFQALIELDWADFDNGKTIGTNGSEGGTIVKDIENSNGARITLEKKSGNALFAVTIGIYGLMFHTHFESDLDKANNYINNAKFRINKIFDLYEVPEERRSDYWKTKHNSQINELAEVKEMRITGEKITPHSKVSKTGTSWWQRLLGS
jgi:hypothetical protein